MVRQRCRNEVHLSSVYYNRLHRQVWRVVPGHSRLEPVVQADFNQGGYMAELSISCQKNVVLSQPEADDDEEHEAPGRILTVDEFIERLRDRKDIFGVDRNYLLRNTEIIALFMAAFACAWFSSIKTIKTWATSNPPESAVKSADVTLGRFVVDPKTARALPPDVARPTSMDNGRRTIRPVRKVIVRLKPRVDVRGSDRARSRLMRVGIISILDGHVRGKEVAGGDILGKGGFAEGIDKLLSGMTWGSKSGGSGIPGRREAQQIGFGTEYGPGGYGGQEGVDVDDFIGNLMASGELQAALSLKTRVLVPINARVSVTDSYGKISGDGRSKTEIMRVVTQNIGALRHAYNRCLRDKPGIKGRITVRFAIDEFGNVIHCEVVSSSIGDENLELTVKSKIMRWKFDRIDKPNDITEVIYPFVFSS
jgi:TonB family protein